MPDVVDTLIRLSTSVLAFSVEKKVDVADKLEIVKLDTFMVLARRVDADKVDAMVVDVVTNGVITVEKIEETVMMVLPKSVVAFH